MTGMVCSSDEQLKTSHLHPEKASFDSMQAGPSSLPPALASSMALTPSPDLASLAQSVAASESLHSGSGDTGVDRGRGSGTSWGRSSDDRRQGEFFEASQSEQGGAGSDTKVPTINLPMFYVSANSQHVHTCTCTCICSTFATPAACRQSFYVKSPNHACCSLTSDMYAYSASSVVMSTYECASQFFHGAWKGKC